MLVHGCPNNFFFLYSVVGERIRGHAFFERTKILREIYDGADSRRLFHIRNAGWRCPGEARVSRALAARDVDEDGYVRIHGEQDAGICMYTLAGKSAGKKIIYLHISVYIRKYIARLSFVPNKSESASRSSRLWVSSSSCHSAVRSRV